MSSQNLFSIFGSYNFEMNGVTKRLKRIDIFGTPVPGFQMQGESEVRSGAGGCATFTIFFILLMFGTLKFVHLMSKANPNISIHLDKENFDLSYEYNLREEGFMMAFALERADDETPLNEPRILKWVAQYKS